MIGKRSRVLLDFVREHRILSYAVGGWFARRHFDDFAQIALLSVWDTLQRYDDHDEMPLPKLAKIKARRAVIDEWRRYFGPRRKKQAHDAAVSFEDVYAEYEHRSEGMTYDPPDEGSDGHFVERVDLWDALDERLRELPLRLAALIRPYFYEGLTLKQCAERCGYTTERLWQILRVSRLPARDKMAPGTITNPVRRMA